MKVSKAQVAEHRERIVESASRLFRRRGFDGVGVAELMAAAGLTNGAFYRHFASKAALIAETCGRVFATRFDPWRRLEGPDGAAQVQGFVRDYLSAQHLAARDDGCLYASLSGDVARQDALVRGVFTDNLSRRLAVLAQALGGAPTTARQRALGSAATLVGALMLARAVADPELSREILDAAGAAVEAVRNAG